MGYNNREIASIVTSEMGDLMATGELTVRAITEHIDKNMDELAKYKEGYMDRCTTAMITAQEAIFKKTHVAETAMGEAYVNKMNEWLDELNNLNIAEQDEDGAYVNTSRFFVIHEAISKLHKTLEKLSGTAALRELSLLKEKMQLEINKAQALGGNLLTTIDAPTTKFSDE